MRDTNYNWLGPVATVTTESGHTWSTEINGTDEEIEKYFIGQSFNVGAYPIELMEKAVKVTVKR